MGCLWHSKKIFLFNTLTHFFLVPQVASSIIKKYILFSSPFSSLPFFFSHTLCCLPFFSSHNTFHSQTSLHTPFYSLVTHFFTPLFPFFFLFSFNSYCQGTSETGDMLHPSTHRAPMYLQNRHSRG